MKLSQIYYRAAAGLQLEAGMEGSYLDLDHKGGQFWACYAIRKACGSKGGMLTYTSQASEAAEALFAEYFQPLKLSRSTAWWEPDYHNNKDQQARLLALLFMVRIAKDLEADSEDQ